MSAEAEFMFDTEWSAGLRQPGDKFHISVNPIGIAGANRIAYGASGGLSVTIECSTIEQLEAEVARLKSDLDKALAVARKALADEPC